MKPFLKWAGGKRWLARRLRDIDALGFERYVEPFVGGGAIFFHFEPSNALLSDSNASLIETYRVLKADWKSVMRLLLRHQRLHSDRYYYEMRDRHFVSASECAAQFIYLNRTCWNGLYRENRQGRFNVPKGTKSTVVFPEDDFEQVSAVLQAAELRSQDFEGVLDETSEGDLAFVDPPYTVKHNKNGFLKYNEKMFSWDDQVRLSCAVRRASERGVRVVMTNAYHSSITRLYADFAHIVQLSRYSVLSGLKEFRGDTQESLITIGLDPDDVLAETCVRTNDFEGSSDESRASERSVVSG